MIHLSPVAKEAGVPAAPPHQLRATINHMNLNWHSLQDGRVFSALHCDLLDEVSGTRYEEFSMIANAHYVKGGRRYLSNGTFEVCLEGLIEFLEERVETE